MPKQLKALHERSQRLLQKIEHLSEEATQLAKQVKEALERSKPAEMKEARVREPRSAQTAEGIK